MRHRTRSALFLACTMLPVALLAQGVTVHSTVDTKLQGALGTAARIAARFGGSSLHDVATTTYISGHKLRTESANSATIIDADAGRITTIDDKARTYTSMTFDEMAAAMKRAQEQAKERADASKSNASAKDADAPKGDMKINYSVSAERPGQHQSVAGYDAERMYLTITMQGDVTPEGGKTEDAGSMVMLIDQWISKDAPQMKAMAEFQRAYSKKAGQAFHTQVQGLQSVFAANPRMKGGLDAAAKEMAKVQGTPLRSTVYLTIVPSGMQFDRTLALGDAAAANATASADAAETKPEEKKGGLGGMFGRLKNAAADAAKASEQKSSNEPPRQSTLLTMTDQVNSIAAGAVPASTFEPPAGYREIKPQTQP